MGPILFNIFLSDLLLVVKDVNFANYADDNTIYQSGRNVDDVINDLKLSAEKLFHCFSDNQMKGNTDKCHLLLVPTIPQKLKSLIKTSICVVKSS